MLGDSVRRRQPKRTPRPRAAGDRSRSWKRLLPIAAAAVLLPFVIGYLLAVYVLFPPETVQGTGIATPQLVGLHASDAERAVVALTLAGLEVVELPHPNAAVGSVIAQSPLPGQQLRSGALVRVAVSAGRPRGVVPDVAGFPDERAFSLLTRLGFQVEQRREYSSVPIGRVLRVEPAPGTMRDLPSTVLLIVSDGPELIEAPDDIVPDTLPPVQGQGPVQGQQRTGVPPGAGVER
jgi:eukaryotic-like serine/threonine-protein kinase